MINALRVFLAITFTLFGLVILGGCVAFVIAVASTDTTTPTAAPTPTVTTVPIPDVIPDLEFTTRLTGNTNAVIVDVDVPWATCDASIDELFGGNTRKILAAIDDTLTQADIRATQSAIHLRRNDNTRVAIAIDLNDKDVPFSCLDYRELSY